MDLYYAEREKHINEVVDCALVCVAKMHRNECTGRDCIGCERRKVLLDVMGSMDDYTRLVTNDRIDAAAIRYLKAHPTEEEVERQLDEEHKMRVKAIKRAAKEANREWLATGQWIHFAMAAVIIPLVPLFALLGEII